MTHTEPEVELHYGVKIDATFEKNTQPPSETQVTSLLSLKGRTAIVTGAGAVDSCNVGYISSIGFGVVEAFAEAGANVALWYNSNPEAIEKANKISKTYGITCKAYKVNITDEEATIKTIDQVVQDLNGRLDIFVANAALYWGHGRLINSSTSNFQEIVNTNLMSTYYAAKAAGKHFQRQKETGTDIYGSKLKNFHSGSFIVTSSIASVHQLFPQATTPYCVTKAAVTQFVKGLAVEFVKFARVNLVCPGYVGTELLDPTPGGIRRCWSQMTPMGREGTVSEMKGAFLYLASDAASYTTGAEIFVDGGYTCL
ncbi:hypothetical protein TWF970_007375 [Orbilia oligospora]|uniref:Sorbose reductase sou1 n=1 Tax=Orbilia oligospora TaxID=2813651 RepID=A0A7C8RFD0_ORBOL|nr:hypothetical protein TWF970_007375 [Orbilia oligospora]